MVVWKELIFKSFLLLESVVVWKELLFNSFLLLGECGGLESTDF